MSGGHLSLYDDVGVVVVGAVIVVVVVDVAVSAVVDFVAIVGGGLALVAVVSLSKKKS